MPIIPDGLRLEDHELATGRTLAEHGLQVVFRVPVFGDHLKNPDAFIDGEAWEFKAPKGSSEKNTIADQFKRGRHQADRLVIDLRRCGVPDAIATRQIRRRFFGQSQLQALIVITHNGAVTIHRLPASL